MPLRHLNPLLTAEAREAVTAAMDAMAECHNETAASSEKVVTKMADAARILGWPEPIIKGMTTQIQSATKMQTQMIDHIMEAWEAQMKSPNPMAQFPSEILAKLQAWPGLQSAGQWPGADAFNGMAADPMRFWTQMGEQWQKNWAQVMTQSSVAPPTQRKKS